MNGIEVKIKDKTGKTILKTYCDHSPLLVKLKPGEYELQTHHIGYESKRIPMGNVEKEKIEISSTTQTVKTFHYPIPQHYGYPPAVILHLDRKKYYKVLRDADEGMYENFHDFIGRSIERSLLIYLNSLKVNDESGKQGYVSLSTATKYCDYSVEYLSLLARKGKLSAVKLQRNWMTRREAIVNYLEEQR